MLSPKYNTFLVLCETRSYTKAAEVLCVTQPSVSHHIKALEEELNIELCYFDDKRKLRLTKAGVILRNYLQTIQADNRLLIQEMNAANNTIHTLSFGTSPAVGEILAPALIASYLEEYPEEQIQHIVDDPSELLKGIDSGELEICVADISSPSTKYVSYPLLNISTSCVASPDHPLAGKRCDFEDLLEYRLITEDRSNYYFRNLTKLMKRNSHSLQEFHRIIEVGNFSTIKKLVRHNVGIAFIDRLAVHQELKNGKLSEIRLPYFSTLRPLNVIWMKNSYFHKRNEQFLRICQQVIQPSRISEILAQYE